MFFVVADTMAISAPNNALSDFRQRLLFALGKGDIASFCSINMVKLQSGGVLSIAAINTAMLKFVVIKEPLESLVALIRLTVLFLAVAGLCKAGFAPFLRFYGVVGALTRFAVRLLDLIRIAFTPTASGLTLTLPFLFIIHNGIVA